MSHPTFKVNDCFFISNQGFVLVGEVITGSPNIGMGIVDVSGVTRKILDIRTVGKSISLLVELEREHFEANQLFFEQGKIIPIYK